MNRWTLVVLMAALLLLAGCGGAARAQAPLPGAPLRPGVALPNQPTVSPYINLLRNNPGFAGPVLNAVNYYGIVRPEFAYQGAIAGLQQQVDLNQQYLATGQGAAAGPLTTGHATFFLNNGGYFLNNAPGRIGTAATASIGRGSAPASYGGFSGAGAGLPGSTGLRTGLSPSTTTPPSRGR
jgi:hypothetical protein